MEGLNFPLLQEELPREFFAVEAEDEKSQNRTNNQKAVVKSDIVEKLGNPDRVGDCKYDDEYSLKHVVNIQACPTELQQHNVT